MISNRMVFVNGFIKLLDETIPYHLCQYAKAVSNGKAEARHHLGFHSSQCPYWIKRLNALLQDSETLKLLQSRYPDWTTVAIQDVITSVTAVQQATEPFCIKKNGAIVHHPCPDASHMENLKTVLKAHVSLD